jgi:hypothetical protein|tara:strand:+ start:123 stop:401 length:279 start_codon:yes stop_codon:yes gene_type:complete
MDVILFETSSSAAADDIAAAVQAQQLWGVDMGTTSKSASYSNYVVVEATATRVSNLMAAIPDDVGMEVHIHDIYSFTDASSEEKLWYLRGKL